jgi:hypothetical protein
MLSKTINGKEYLFVEVPAWAKVFEVGNTSIYYSDGEPQGEWRVPKLPSRGKYEVIGKASELTEEQWGEIVEPVSFAGKTYFHNYLASSRDFRDIVEAAFGTAKESGLSLLLTILPTLETSPETTLIIEKLC